MKGRLVALAIAVLALMGANALGATSRAINFRACSTVPTIRSANAIAVGDFNRDGKMDIVEGSGDDVHEAYVLLGLGDGTFSAPIGVGGSSVFASAVVVGDFNRDSHLDFAIANNLGSIDVFLGNGDGTFQAPVRYATGLNAPLIITDTSFIAAGDVTGDGRLDLVMVGSESMSGRGARSLLVGVGDGTFSPPIIDTTPGSTPSAVALQDMNNDGTMDILITDNTPFTSNFVSVLISNKNGTFTHAGDFPTDSNPQAVAAGDFNGDGKADVVTVNAVGDVSVLLGNGDGTLGIAVNYPTSSSPFMAGVFDMNGDGKLDLVVATGANDVNLLWGNGDGTFQPAVSYGCGPTIFAAVADFNGDHKPDIATVSATIQIVLNLGSAIMQAPRHFLLTSGNRQPVAMATADFNKDGKTDIAVTDSNSNSSSVDIFLGKGDGTLAAAKTFSAGTSGTQPQAMIAGDFNGDSKQDLVVLQTSGEIDFLAGNGDGTFQAPAQLSAQGSLALATADVNGDKKLDLIVFAPGSSTSLQVMFGNGDGTFQSPTSYTVGVQQSAFAGIVIADFNNDKHLDIAVTSRSDNAVTVLLNQGNGTFTVLPSTGAGSAPMHLAAGDFNHDGNMDLAVADSSTVDILLGVGNGTFQTPAQAPGFFTGYLGTADFNHDGNLDLALASFTGTAVVLQDRSNGTFLAPVSFPGGNSPVSLMPADLNRDGSTDLVLANQQGNDIVVLLNTAGTLVKLTSSPNPSTAGQPVTFTATVSASVPTLNAAIPSGTITFRDGATTLGTATLNGGVGSMSTSTLTTGTHFIKAVYSGDGTYNPNNSKLLTQTVN
jgi:Big-like domain-containing protein/VCBS repeat protein/FG-GAP repeat protein